MKITDAFQIYVINLPERTDRLATALKEMRKIGLERGDAGLTIFSAIKPSDAAGFHRASIRGIFLSQLACLEDAYKRGKHALIFEDDIALATSLAPLLDQILKTLETSEWGFCYLGHESSGDIPRAGRRASSFSLKPHTGDMIGAHFVMVHRSVLPKLIQHLLTVQSGRPGDTILARCQSTVPIIYFVG